MRDEITKEIQLGQDMRIEAWIPLDWAKAYKMIGEIEQCIDEAREFYRRCTIMQSPHAVSQVDKLLTSLEKNGYAEVQAVKDFREEIREEQGKQKA